MKQATSHLHEHLGYWLRQLSNRVSTSFAERLERHGVSVPQWVVLRVLFDANAMPLKEIVSRVGVDQGALSRMVERLIALGLVAREEDRNDRRAVAISLTPGGRKLVPRLAKEADENDATFFASLNPRQHEEFVSTIKSLLTLNGGDSRGIPID